MKKLIAMLLALTLVAAMFVACGQEKTPETNESTEAPETTVATEATEGGLSTDDTQTGDVEETVEVSEPLVEMSALEIAINGIIEKNPVEFMGGIMPVDLTDTSEDGLWAIKNFTGLSSAEKLSEIAVFEPMMGSLAFSMVLVRVNDAAEAQNVAQEMSDNIDTRKWICVEANDKIVVGHEDVVMLIMLDNTNGMSAQSFVDAFVEIVGAADFTI